MFLLLLLLLGLLLAFCCLFLSWPFNHWRCRGVKGPRPWPLLGSYPSLLSQRQHFADDLRDLYMQYRSSESYVGVFLLRTPQLLLLEPRLVHEVFVSAFKNFENNDAGRLIDVRKDRLLLCNPFILDGAAWREQRAMVSPVLTSLRIKTAYSIMVGVCDDLCSYIEQFKSTDEPLNAKDLALRFTAENLCDCVLGIKALSFSDKPLPVSEHIRSLSEENPAFVLAGAISGLFPRLLKYFRLKIFPLSCDRFFGQLLGEAFRLRRHVHLERHDFMNQLLELQRQHGLSDTQLISHAMTFLIDGLDTSAATIAHCLLLLARNPECQQQLLEELTSVCPKATQLPSYEQLQELPYLDACFHESLRIYPPGLWAAKTCTEAHTFQGSRRSAPLKLEPGDTVMIPIYGLHHDPLYYPEPEAFRPERFLPENGGTRKYRNMGVFLAFGAGPRQCLGVRLALVQSKAAIAAIIRRFEVRENDRTEAGQRLDPKIFVALHKGGVWLDFVVRQPL